MFVYTNMSIVNYTHSFSIFVEGPDTDNTLMGKYIVSVSRISFFFTKNEVILPTYQGKSFLLNLNADFQPKFTSAYHR